MAFALSTVAFALVFYWIARVVMRERTGRKGWNLGGSARNLRSYILGVRLGKLMRDEKGQPRHGQAKIDKKLTWKLLERVAKLRDEIREHEHRYYLLDRPSISDAEFDLLMNELKQLEAGHPELVTPNSPMQRVGGAPRKGFETRRHVPPMLSLDNAFSFEELDRFDRRAREVSGRQEIEYIVEHKYHGLSMSLHYDQGQLALAVTRGDGVNGEDVTATWPPLRPFPSAWMPPGPSGWA